MRMTSAKKRPHAGSATARVWEIADELFRKTGRIPTGREVVDIYVRENYHESTGFTQYSHWKKAHLEQFKRGGSSASKVAAQPFSVGPAQLSIGADGRVVIPAEMRTAMEIGPDGRVTAHVVDGELRIMAPKVAIRRAQALVRGAVPAGVSLADELIAERRAEARRDDAS